MRLANLGIVLGLITALVAGAFVNGQDIPPNSPSAPVSTSTKELLFRGAPSAKTGIEFVGPFGLSNPDLQARALREVSEEASKEPIKKIMKVTVKPTSILGANEPVIKLYV